MLVGPKSNPANLADSDDVLTMFNKIVTRGNADVSVSEMPLHFRRNLYLARA